MDTNRLLIWFTVLGVVANVLALFVVRRRPPVRQLAPFALVYLVLGGAVTWLPDDAGAIGFAAFCALVLAPGLWLQLVNLQLVQGRYHVAAVLGFWMRPAILALAHPEREASLSEQQRDRLWELQHSVSVQRNSPQGPAVGTAVMIALNLIAFVLEVPGGTENETNLASLGGLEVPVDAWAPNLWRLVVACFLHYGVLHITMNLLGLRVFGRRVEQSLGTARWLVVYLSSGVLSMTLYAALGTWLQIKPTLVVGASGCVMGMIGSMFALSYIDWRHSRTSFGGRQVALIGIVVATQAVFDMLNPEIAMSVHVSGLVIGALLTAALRFGSLRTRPIPG